MLCFLTDHHLTILPVWRHAITYWFHGNKKNRAGNHQQIMLRNIPTNVFSIDLKFINHFGIHFIHFKQSTNPLNL